jgi:MYXO-CTERM domain-containing protein
MRRSSAAARRALAGAALVAGLAPAAPAAAYCRTSVCPEIGTAAVCTPAQPTDCGIPLFWPAPCVGFSLQETASAQVGYAEAEAIFEQAFATWMAADCGGGATPRIKISNAGPVACDQHEYNQDKGNANIIVFRDSGWPHPGSEHTLALTTVTYNLDTGEIYDADMELNSAEHDFTTGDTGVVFDLASIATHEAGHFLGLSHTPDTEATMYFGYDMGSTTLRDLNADDVAGICAAYPPGEIAACDPTPRHGFSGLCAEDQGEEDEGCSVAAAGGAGGGWLGAALALAALGAARRRRGRGSTPAVHGAIGGAACDSASSLGTPQRWR